MTIERQVQASPAAAINIAQLGEVFWRNQCVRLETENLALRVLAEKQEAELEKLRKPEGAE